MLTCMTRCFSSPGTFRAIAFLHFVMGLWSGLRPPYSYCYLFRVNEAVSSTKRKKTNKQTKKSSSGVAEKRIIHLYRIVPLPSDSIASVRRVRQSQTQVTLRADKLCRPRSSAPYKWHVWIIERAWGQDPGGGGHNSHINRTVVLVENLQNKNRLEVPRSCFVSMAWNFFTPKWYQF